MRLSQIIIWVLGWIPIALSIIFVTILFSPIRYKCAFERHLSKDGRKKKVAEFYEDHLHSLVLGRQILLFWFPTAVLIVLSIWASIELEYFVGSFVLGLSILIFVSTQLPLLMKAHLLIIFKIDDGEWGSRIDLRSGKTTKIEFAIRNLGFSTYKNFVVKFYFGPDFKIIPYNHSKYKNLDFEKEFSIQKRHGGAMFTPKETFLAVPPQEVIIFPLIIKVPDESKKYRLRIDFNAENTWGMNVIYKAVFVK